MKPVILKFWELSSTITPSTTQINKYCGYVFTLWLIICGWLLRSLLIATSLCWNYHAMKLCFFVIYHMLYKSKPASHAFQKKKKTSKSWKGVIWNIYAGFLNATLQNEIWRLRNPELRKWVYSVRLVILRTFLLRIEETFFLDSKQSMQSLVWITRKGNNAVVSGKIL